MDTNSLYRIVITGFIPGTTLRGYPDEAGKLLPDQASLCVQYRLALLAVRLSKNGSVHSAASELSHFHPSLFPATRRNQAPRRGLIPTPILAAS
jgi:hypothetical protein